MNPTTEKASHSSGMKAQGALEYLMQYGWAILIIVVVGAALYALGVLNPESYPRDNSVNLCSTLNYANGTENVTCTSEIHGRCFCNVEFYNEQGFITGTTEWYHVMPTG